jgi:hypothetical protein
VLDPAGELVILVCKPFLPAKLGSDDRRRLGVPVCSLEFREDDPGEPDAVLVPR